MDSIRRAAAELARSKPDVIVPYATRVLNAVREATRDIPVVFLATSDPVGLGFVQSLARPGGNLPRFCTGVERRDRASHGRNHDYASRRDYCTGRAIPA